MISIHQGKHESEVARGWLNPFLADRTLWLPHQISAEPDRLDSIADAMTYYCWSPALYYKGHRLNENFISAHYMALDFDEGRSLDSAIDFFRPYRCVIGTTRSHQIIKIVGKEKVEKPACDRFRVLLTFTRPVENFDIFKATLQDWISKMGSDKSCSDARFFYPCQNIVYIGPENGHRVTPIPPPKKRPFKGPQGLKPPNHRGKYVNALIAGAGLAPGGRHDALLMAAWEMAHTEGQTPDSVLAFLKMSTNKDDHGELERIVEGAFRKAKK